MRYISFFFLEYVYTLKQLVSNNCNTFNMCSSMTIIIYMKQLHGFNVISRPALQTTSNWGFPLPHFPKPTTVDFSVSIEKKKNSHQGHREIFTPAYIHLCHSNNSLVSILQHISHFEYRSRLLKLFNDVTEQTWFSGKPNLQNPIKALIYYDL